MSEREQNASPEEGTDLVPEQMSSQSLDEEPIMSGDTADELDAMEEINSDGEPASEEGPPPIDDLQLAEQEELGEIPDEPPELTVQKVKKRSGGSSPGRLGLLFFLATLLAGAGSSYAMLYIMGGRLQQLLELQPPLLYIAAGVVGGMLLLAIFGSMAISRAATATSRHYEASENLLDKIARLNIQEMEGWQDEDFTIIPELANNLLTMKYTHERLISKHTRTVGLDGELLRLEKALVNGERIDLTSKYDHPAAGRLADEALRLLDERAQARTRWEELTNKLKDTGEPLCQGVNDATRWNNTTFSELQHQAKVVTNLKKKIELLVQAAHQQQQESQGDDALNQALANAESELSRAVVSDANQTLSTAAAALRDLVEREGKLAFQIAMVVARLGRDGEPLLPLTQKLEGLTNDFKQIASKLDELVGNHEGSTAVVHSVCKQLQGVQGLAGKSSKADQIWEQVAVRIKELTPAVNQVLATLNEMPPQFNLQTERLNELGSACAQLTGVTYEKLEPGEIDGTAESSDMEVERFDPFSNGEAATSPSGEEPLAARPPVPGANGVTNTGAKSKAQRKVAPAAEPIFENTQSVDPFAATSDTDQAPLPESQEKVYDLSEFDAVTVADKDAAAAKEEDRIYDLEEFGAVAIS